MAFFSKKPRKRSALLSSGILGLVAATVLTGCMPNLEDPLRDQYTRSPDEQAKPDRWLKDMMNERRDVIDPYGSLTRDEYKESYQSRAKPKMAKDDGIVMPDIAHFLEEPKKPAIANDKLVTISVTEDVPLKDVLIELARRADVDMEIDPNIQGGIIFRAKDRPFTEVIDRISGLAKLRYEVVNGVMKIERDSPYIRNYRLNLLNMVRSSSSSVNISTDLLGGGETDGGFSSGSTSSLQAASDEGDVWAVIERGVDSIIAPQEADFVDAGLSSVAPIPPSRIISVNRQGGIVSVFASGKEHEEVKAYLDYIHMSHSSQVLIEAKILEVKLDDQYRSGIDWNFLNNNVTGISARTKFDSLGLDTTNADQVFTFGVLPSELLGLDGTSLEASIQLVESFGVTRTLSSPRLHAMNNQFAVLTFAENFVYFELDVQEETEDTGNGQSSTLTIDTQIKTVPIGVLLSIQPSIDMERDEVVMSVRPTLSRITGFVEDPGVALIAAQVGQDSLTSSVPVVEIRELDSILRLRDGQVMVIGGLMEERTQNTDTGVPGVSSVPLLGNAFKKVNKETEIVETVIFIKATIVPGSGVSVEDKDFYKKFSKDRHPLSL